MSAVEYIEMFVLFRDHQNHVRNVVLLWIIFDSKQLYEPYTLRIRELILHEASAALSWQQKAQAQVQVQELLPDQ